MPGSFFKKLLERITAPSTKVHPHTKLSESLDELKNAFEAMNAAVWIIDNKNFILYANQVAQRLFNSDQQDMIGRKCWEIAHGTGQPVEECPVLRSRHSLNRESMELQIEDKWFEVQVDPILDAKGEISRFIHIITDITEKKRTNERLQRSERLLSNAQRLAKTGGWEWDIHKQKMFWTEELYRLHGFDPNDFEPGSVHHIKASLQCYTPEYRQILTNVFRKCVEEGVAYDLECEFRKFSGEKIWIRTAAEPVWNDGKIERITGFFMDITDIKHAREALLVKSERLKTLFNAIDDAIFVHPLEKEGFAPFVEVNDIACKRYGYTYEEFTNMSAPDITVKPDVEGHAQQKQRSELLKSKHQVFQTYHVKKSGEKFPVEISSNIFHQHEKPYILAVVRDITQRKADEENREKLIAELEEALENINTLRGLLPICSNCKKIRDDQGYWNVLESYIQTHTGASFSHSLCPDCCEKLYCGENWYEEMKRQMKDD